MKDDVRKYIFTTLTILVLGSVVWIVFLFLNSCGFTLTCKRASFAVERTSIPTLIPATLPAMETGSGQVAVSDRCRVAAVDLIGAWVSSGSSETKVFQFTDIKGQNCESTFEEVKPLFLEANFWYSGSLSCVSCHSVDVTISPAQLDLSSYAGILSGSRRADVDSKGTDILGAGKWNGSLLYEFLSTNKPDIPGHTKAVSDLVIFAGKQHSIPVTTPVTTPITTPTP